MLLENSNLYCQKCDEITTICNNCRVDPYVSNYKKINSDYGVSYSHVYRFSSASELEEFAIKKHSGVNGSKMNKKLLAKVLKLKEERITARKKYILIREELVNLINKFFDNDASYIDIGESKIRIAIREYCDIDIDPFTAACQIYEKIKEPLELKITKEKIIMLFDNKINELFAENAVILKNIGEYINLIKTQETLEQATNFINEPNNIKLLQTMLDEKLRINQINDYLKNKGIFFRKEFADDKNLYVKGQIDFETCVNNLLNIEKHISLQKTLDNIVTNLVCRFSYIFRIKYGKIMIEYCKELPEAIEYINGNYTKTPKTLQNSISKKLSKEFVPKYREYSIKITLGKNRISNVDVFYETISTDETIKKYINDVKYNSSDYIYELPQNIIERINFMCDNILIDDEN